LAAVGVLLLFGFALSWVGVAIGSLIGNVEAVQTAGMTLVMPLTFLSSAFVPTSTMPAVVRAFAENQPITHVIDAVRGLVLGTPSGTAIWLAIAWCCAIAVVLAPLSVRRYQRL
jgi:ABC-type multidrug transport system permease subunit